MTHSVRPTSIVRRIQTVSIPLYLAPAFSELRPATLSASSRRAFSSTPCPHQKTKKDKFYKERGVSVIRSKGPKVPLSVTHLLKKAGHPGKVYPTPEQNPEAKYASDSYFQTNPKHGLWDFFEPKKRPLLTPEQEGAFGRAWTYAELEEKGFDDLHALYWICFKERNRVLTRQAEHDRHNAGYGRAEQEEKYEAISETMQQIRSVLIDRHDSWEEAQALLRKHPIKDLFPEDEEVYELEDVESEELQPVSSSDPKGLPEPVSASQQVPPPPEPRRQAELDAR